MISTTSTPTNQQRWTDALGMPVRGRTFAARQCVSFPAHALTGGGVVETTDATAAAGVAEAAGTSAWRPPTS